MQINQCVANALKEGRTLDEGYSDAGINLGRMTPGTPEVVVSEEQEQEIYSRAAK